MCYVVWICMPYYLTHWKMFSPWPQASLPLSNIGHLCFIACFFRYSCTCKAMTSLWWFSLLHCFYPPSEAEVLALSVVHMILESLEAWIEGWNDKFISPHSEPQVLQTMVPSVSKLKKGVREQNMKDKEKVGILEDDWRRCCSEHFVLTLHLCDRKIREKIYWTPISFVLSIYLLFLKYLIGSSRSEILNQVLS